LNVHGSSAMVSDHNVLREEKADAARVWIAERKWLALRRVGSTPIWRGNLGKLGFAASPRVVSSDYDQRG